MSIYTFQSIICTYCDSSNHTFYYSLFLVSVFKTVIQNVDSACKPNTTQIELYHPFFMYTNERKCKIIVTLSYQLNILLAPLCCVYWHHFVALLLHHANFLFKELFYMQQKSQCVSPAKKSTLHPMSTLGFGCSFGHCQTNEACQTSHAQTNPSDDCHSNQSIFL